MEQQKFCQLSELCNRSLMFYSFLKCLRYTTKRHSQAYTF